MAKSYKNPRLHKFSKFKKFTKRRKIITVFFLTLFIASVVFIVIPMTAGAGWGNIGVWFPVIYFFLLFAVSYNLEELRRILKKAYRPLIFLFYLGTALFFIVFTVFCYLILGYTSNDIPDNPDLIIVLGCQVRGYEPGNLLRYRLETALKTLDKYNDAICIVAGGQGPDEIVPEAQVMKQYLADRGIERDRIYEEDKSSSSFENLIFSKKIIENNNFNYKNIVILTSDYHVPRAVMIANRVYPDADIYAVKANAPFALFSAGIVREFFAFMKSFVVDRV